MEKVRMMRSVSAVLILDIDGKRVVSHYYDEGLFPDKDAHLAFEKKVSRQKCLPQTGISLIDGLVCVNANYSDLRFFVVGPASKNEVSFRTRKGTISWTMDVKILDFF
jgi:hypothetical protein